MNQLSHVKAGLAGALALALLAVSAADAAWPGDPPPCPPDAVKAGSVCVDKYEASVWRIPGSMTMLIQKVRAGTATLLELNNCPGCSQISPAFSAFGNCAAPFPATFPVNGQWTVRLYAVSIQGVQPTACVSWLQAQAACGNSRKRLPTNAEWQLAVAGTPDGGAGDNHTVDCNTATSPFNATPTGARPGCVSNWGSGHFDMVGNVSEFVADWVPASTTCPGWDPAVGALAGNLMCFAGASTTQSGPGVLVRGGDSNGPNSFSGGPRAGPLTIWNTAPYATDNKVGFRCAR